MSGRGKQSIQGRTALVRSAVRLKKAWLLAAALAGYSLSRAEALIPDYGRWTHRELQKQVADLEEDLQAALGEILIETPKRITPSAIRWLEDSFDEWATSGFGILVVSTVQEFEAAVGQLRALEVRDVPPYAQVLLQPGIEVAFRHPEYMLGRDLGLLYGLFRDAEDLLAEVDWSRPPDWAPAASENALTLGRATIECCFNLLEAFTAGLARARLMSSADLDDDLAGQIRDTSTALKKRIVRVPNLLRDDKTDLDINKPPFSVLFGDVKRRRDSFVHCEPGPQQSERGYVKEDYFHDAFAPEVETAVDVTCDAVCMVWDYVYDRPKPQWLHERGEDGRFVRPNLRLRPSDSA